MKTTFKSERVRVISPLVRADEEEWNKYSKELGDHNKGDWGNYKNVPEGQTAGYVTGMIGNGEKVHDIFARTAIDENGETVLWIVSVNCGSRRINWNTSPVYFVNNLTLDKVNCAKCLKRREELPLFELATN